MVAVGPYLVPVAGTATPSPEVASAHYALELAHLAQTIRIPLYRRQEGDACTLSDYFCHEKNLPPALKCRPHYYYSMSTAAGLFLPLESLLVTLYEAVPGVRPLMCLLSDLRTALLPPIVPSNGSCLPRQAFQPEITQLGFYLLSARTYSRRLTASIGWFCPADRQALEQAPCFPAGALEFRPRPDRTLDAGRWIPAATTPVAALLRNRLQAVSPGAPIHLLSDEGRQFLLDSYQWTALALMTRNQARQARVQFVREHPELMDRPRELALAMCQAHLYSATCNPHEVARYMASLVGEARQPAT